MTRACIKKYTHTDTTFTHFVDTVYFITDILKPASSFPEPLNNSADPTLGFTTGRNLVTPELANWQYHFTSSIAFFAGNSILLSV